MSGRVSVPGADTGPLQGLKCPGTKASAGPGLPELDWAGAKEGDAVFHNLRLHRTLWAIAGLLTLAAAVTGVMDAGIYSGIVSPDLIPGAFSQDLISIVASACLIVLALAGGNERPKVQLLVLGLLGYLFYAYGIYVIERAYNSFYLVYMAIFSLTFWALVAAGVSLRRDLPTPRLSRTVRITSASGALLQPLIFYPLWVAMLLPLMSTREQIDSLYSIFILDLCFIMPAFLLLAVLTYRSHPLGLMLLPAMYVLGFTLIFSLALGEVVKPLFGLEANMQSFWLSLALSIFFAIIGAWHLLKLQFPHEAADGKRTAGEEPLDAASDR